jgi:hypothetical protein
MRSNQASTLSVGICFVGQSCFTESAVWEGTLYDAKFVCLAKDLVLINECSAVHIPKFESRMLG